MKLVLIGFDMPHNQLHELKDTLGGYYEFQTVDPHHFDTSLVRKAEVLVLRSSNPKIISEASHCRWIHSWNAGVDDLLTLDTFKGDHSPVLTNSAGAYGDQISEHVFGMIFAFTRGIKAIVLNQEQRKWDPVPTIAGDKELLELSGRTIGIIGLGHVGLGIAKRAKSFGLKVVGLKRNAATPLRVSDSNEYVDTILGSDNLATALSKSDIVVNVLPLTLETNGLFNAKSFGNFKRGAIFVSVGRGKTVVERDLIEALRDGVVGFAALDVYSEEPLPANSPLWKMKNVLVSPHCAGRSDHQSDKALSILKSNLLKFSKNEPLENKVDLTAGY